VATKENPVGVRIAFLFVVVLLLALSEGRAAEPGLQITFESKVRSFDAASLLARPEARSILVPNDVAYKRDMNFRAVPLLALLAGLPLERADTLETRATDGFVSQLPMALILKAAKGGSVPWLSIDDASAPWPPMPGRSKSAGPFYLVWLDPERSDIGREQWPYALSSLTAVEPPVQRWPQIAVDPALPADDPTRHGQAVFIVQCLPCHRIRGGGEGEMGPDLVQPKSPTEYMTPAGLMAQIRNPKSLRSWPSQQMPGFDEAALSTPELDAVIAYLKHMVGRRDAAR
jgi:mono/diheme cytochrome c family protein